MSAELHDGERRPILPLCPARWSRHERGYIEVHDPFTGELVEIPARDATRVWKGDLDAATARRKLERGR